MALAAGATAAFLEGTAVYALSQQWEDLLSTYLLRLHAVPYCGVHLLACSAHVENNAGMAGQPAQLAEAECSFGQAEACSGADGRLRSASCAEG